ncbi:PSP1-domain-containing protein [Hesseltinella vesiculosa]|uniref:PSP1-domain-containing protein n=1 Tax=Hesseltinella vesiculosa TaxID=101127 RepID=A0A1X2GMH1_9FUNG|nr:PSP1-domain-containing protein [Hesseltinella vesiculosa]
MSSNTANQHQKRQQDPLNGHDKAYATPPHLTTLHPMEKAYGAWDSFAGFRWENDARPPDIPQTSPHPLGHDPIDPPALLKDPPILNSILAVPMIPSVPPEPMYRPHRSMSFSVGHDYAFYNDDDNDTYRSSLATMREESEDDDPFLDRSRRSSLHSPLAPYYYDSAPPYRFRSQSSSVSFAPFHQKDLPSAPGPSPTSPTNASHPSIMRNPLLRRPSAPWSSSSITDPSPPTQLPVSSSNRRRRSSLATLWLPASDNLSNASSSLDSQPQPLSPTSQYPFAPLSMPPHKDDETLPSLDYCQADRKPQSTSFQHRMPLNGDGTYQTGSPMQPTPYGYAHLPNQLETMNLHSQPPSPLPYTSASTPFLRHPQDGPPLPHHPPSFTPAQLPVEQQPSPATTIMPPHLSFQPTSVAPSNYFPPYALHPYQQPSLPHEPVMYPYIAPSPSAALPVLATAPLAELSHSAAPSSLIATAPTPPSHPTLHNTATEQPSVAALPPTSSPSATPAIPISVTSLPNLDPSPAPVSTTSAPILPSTPIPTSSPADDNRADASPSSQQDLGKGIPLHRLALATQVYVVEFKAGRIDYFYVANGAKASPPIKPTRLSTANPSRMHPMVNDLVIVEADRGTDLGKVVTSGMPCEQLMDMLDERTPPANDHPDAILAKRIFRLAAPDEISHLLVKGQDEQRALVICQQKIKQRKLQMEVVDAEYQWDRRKLTFYFNAEKRIDFRDLVREMFKIYKTRIWMCAVNNKRTVSLTDG